MPNESVCEAEVVPVKTPRPVHPLIALPEPHRVTPPEPDPSLPFKPLPVQMTQPLVFNALDLEAHMDRSGHLRSLILFVLRSTVILAVVLLAVIVLLRLLAPAVAILVVVMVGLVKAALALLAISLAIWLIKAIFLRRG